MGNRNNEARGVLMRTKAYFNSSIFSDIEFQVKDTDGQIKIFYAHKLILAMAGEGFAKLFYNSKAPQTNTIKIAEFTPYIVHLMLKYIYSDEIRFTSIEAATNLFRLADHFDVFDLMEKCNSFISKYQVNFDTLFAKYETALPYQQRGVLQVCRRLASSETRAVFESPNFCTASRFVIEDILKLNEFSVSGELEVIEAALKWCKAVCKRRSRPSEVALCVRDDFLPLCKHLRFLCLRIDEFLDFAEENDIFTSEESDMLTAKILDKDDAELSLPKEFSVICTPRCSLVNGDSARNVNQDAFSRNNGNAAVSNYPLQSDAASNFSQTNPKTVLDSVNPSYFSYKPVSPKNAMKQKENENFHYAPPQRNAAVHKVIPLKSDITSDVSPENAMKSKDDEIFHYTPPQRNGTVHKVIPLKSDITSDVCPKNATKLNEDEIFHYSPPQRNAVVHKVIPLKNDITSDESPMNAILKEDDMFDYYIRPPVYKVIPQPESNLFMSFDFRLHEMQKGMASAVNNDLKCRAAIKMLRGTMRINALELRVKDLKNCADESIEVHLCFTNKASQKSHSQVVHLKNSVLYLPFNAPYTVSPKDMLDIEVTIEDLKMNRCNVYRYQESHCELNCGLNVTAEINLSSNQSNGTDSFFFLISKILYSIP